jgi:hypothetical protein
MPVLTKRLVVATAPRETEYQIYDGEIPGLALRVNPNSRKVGGGWRGLSQSRA